VINGQKIFVAAPTAPMDVDRLLHGPERRAAPDLSWFMINASLPGITVQR